VYCSGCIVEALVVGYRVPNPTPPAATKRDVETQLITLRQFMRGRQSRTLNSDVVIHTEIGGSARGRIVRIEAWHRDVEEHIVCRRNQIRRVQKSGAAVAVEARAIERDVAGKPLIDGNVAAVPLLGRIVPSDIVGIELIPKTIGCQIG